eukprot:92733-Prymnesium_polylepis.1
MRPATRSRRHTRPPRGVAGGRGVAVGSPRGVRGAPSTQQTNAAENGPRPGRQSCGVAQVPEGWFGEVRVGRKSRDPSRAVSDARLTCLKPRWLRSEEK